jgi:hypothetical protein
VADTYRANTFTQAETEWEQLDVRLNKDVQRWLDAEDLEVINVETLGIPAPGSGEIITATIRVHARKVRA